MKVWSASWTARHVVNKLLLLLRIHLNCAVISIASIPGSACIINLGTLKYFVVHVLILAAILALSNCCILSEY